MDLPPVSTNPSVPLPDVAPDSAQVPYRIGVKKPGEDYVYTTGYGPRAARQPIAPPPGFNGGVGAPDLSALYEGAFANLPVEQATKAIEVATKYIGQRGYMNDLNSGASAAQAFAKWAPMLFHGHPTGLSESIQRSTPQPMSEYQRAQLANQRVAAANPVVRNVGKGLYRVPATGPVETLIAPPAEPEKLTEAQEADLAEAKSDLEAAKKDATKNLDKPFDDPDVLNAATRAVQARNKIDKIVKRSIQVPATPAATVSATTITHRYDPKTGKFEQVK